MLTQLYGKGGNVCQPAREGKLRCPLIVRPTSEDVITGHFCQVFRTLNARWWLPDLLNAAVAAHRFRRQVFRELRIEPWKNYPRYPRELLPWDEGSTQVDLVITWENPPTTVFLEMKYLADLSRKTAGDDGRRGYPSDQLIRNARVGLLACGWFGRGRLFRVPPRDFVLILLAPTKGHPLVAKYRDSEKLTAAVPHSEKLRGLPKKPFIGELSYRDVTQVLRKNRRWFTRPERILSDSLADFLAYKARTVSADSRASQGDLPLT